MIVKIQGGIGNQMFQYAFAKQLQIKYNTQVYLDNTQFNTNDFITQRDFSLSIFNITLETIPRDLVDEIIQFNGNSIKSRIKRKTYKNLPWHNRKVKIEKSLSFDERNLNFSKYYIGYWQSEKYFFENSDQIRFDFQFKNYKYLSELGLFNKIQNSNSVSIHIRRGDYVNNPKVRKFNGVLPLDYYVKAINLVKSKIDNPQFFVFSDEIEWVRENFFSELNVSYVSNSNQEEDLFLMSNCKHNIIANSTFSWWGAYLNENQTKIVIAPKSWYQNKKANQTTKDLIPLNWIRI